MRVPITLAKYADGHNWLTAKDEGMTVLVTGHWSGDFQGIVEYGGHSLAIIIDSDGNSREVCYLHPVVFHRLDYDNALPLLSADDEDVPF